jgi:hypothetical protein
MAATNAALDARAQSARVDKETLVISLRDGRELRVPVAWFPRLSAGTPKQRSNVRIIEDGRALNWPDLDEDIGIAPLLSATP